MKKKHFSVFIFLVTLMLIIQIKSNFVHGNFIKTTQLSSSISNSFTTTKFTSEDAKALGIRIDMPKDRVIKILGQPKKIEQSTGPTDVFVFYYKFGEVHFDPLNATTFTVSQIFINRPNYAGPRNIKINDSIETVLHKFPYNKNTTVDVSGDIYVYGENGKDSGFITYDENKNVSFVTYTYGEGGFGTFSLRMEVKNNKVKFIRIGVMNI